MYVDRDDMYFGNDRLALVEAALAAARKREGRGGRLADAAGDGHMQRDTSKRPGGRTDGDRDRDAGTAAAPRRGRSSHGEHPHRRREEGRLGAPLRRQDPRLLARLQDADHPRRLDGRGRRHPLRPAQGRPPGRARRHHHQEAVPGLRAGGRVGGDARRQQRHLLSRQRGQAAHLRDRPRVPGARQRGPPGRQEAGDLGRLELRAPRAGQGRHASRSASGTRRASASRART